MLVVERRHGCMDGNQAPVKLIWLYFQNEIYENNKMQVSTFTTAQVWTCCYLLIANVVVLINKVHLKKAIMW